MSALAQTTRMRVFERLVAELPGGMAASAIADAVGLSRNAMSPHFAILSAAGLVSSEKTGRTVTYKAETGPVEALSNFLADACARGRKARNG